MAAKMASSGDGFPWVNLVGFGILAVCYAAALFNVFQLKQEQADVEVIRIVHWQLELGVRDGLEALIDAFEERKAAEGNPVQVVQIPMPENAYQQYVTTQMIGGTAPDMIQIGHNFPKEFYGRYFVPFSEVLQQPNAYLAERVKELEAEGGPAAERWLEPTRKLVPMAWKDTFTDGLNSLFNDEVQEFFGVGFSQFTVRMFYNKDLFRAALGHARPPASYQDLGRMADRLRGYGEEQGIEIIPVASSKYQMGIFKWRFNASVTADLSRRFDLNGDGWCFPEEILVALLTGDWTPDNPQYKAGYDLLLDLTRYFPRGFMALGRMDSGFSFVQGRAAMITSGSWDAKSFLEKIRNQPEDQRFDVGIFEVPIIDEHHPQYGKYFDGRPSEANTGTGFSFGITRNSRHVDLCIEFLQFCTSPENNTLVNEYAEWIPSVRGAKATTLLEAFEPDFTGYWGEMTFITGVRGELLERQVFWPYISGEIDYAGYAEELMDALPGEAVIDYSRAYSERAEALPNRRARRASYLAVAALTDDPAGRNAGEIKLGRAWDTLLTYELGQSHLRHHLEIARRQNAETGSEPAFAQEFFKLLEREQGN